MSPWVKGDEICSVLSLEMFLMSHVQLKGQRGPVYILQAAHSKANAVTVLMSHEQLKGQRGPVYIYTPSSPFEGCIYILQAAHSKANAVTG